MGKQKNVNLLVTCITTTVLNMILCTHDPNEKWQHRSQAEHAYRWQPRTLLAPEEYCPLVTPVCPCCDVYNPGKNCFVVTRDDDPQEFADGTLRAALEAANASDATECKPFAIVFNIPGGAEEEALVKRSCAFSKPTECTALEGDVRTIVLNSALPEIAKPVCINGFTQPGSNEERRIIAIEIDGDSEDSDGLVLQPTAKGSTIKGISIGNFNSSSHALIRVLASRSKISGNNIGVRADGVTSVRFAGSGGDKGIVIDSGTDVTIGGVTFQDKNVISSTNIGAEINTPGVTFAGNFVGTDVTGTALLPNRFAALTVNSDSNIIGCNSHFGRNIFAVQLTFDVNIFGNNNLITNCFLGINVSGTQQISQSSVGIFLNAVSNTTIKHCLIGGYVGGAIAAIMCSSTTISQCFIGTDITGNSALGGDPSGAGIAFVESQNNEVSSNLISYKDGIGIGVANSSNTVIRDNFIGTNATGTCPIAGVQEIGVALISQSCQGGEQVASFGFMESLKEIQKEKKATRAIADCCPVFFGPNDAIKNLMKHNLISGNRTAGIFLSGARLNTIAHNKIGTDVRGRCSILNGYGLFFLGGAQSNTVECNLIAGNSFNGIIAAPRA